MKKIIVQTLDNNVIDREIESIDQISKFVELIKENDIQLKNDVIFYIDYIENKISKININFINDAKLISVYKALNKKNYLTDYIGYYLKDFVGDLTFSLQSKQQIPEQFNKFNQRINSSYEYGSVFKELNNQQFLEDGNISKLYSIDPLPKKPYFLWLVDQYKKEKLLTEDFFKAKELLLKFSNKKILSDIKKNGFPTKIWNYSSINDLFKAIDSLAKDLDYDVDRKYALVKARTITENDEWIVCVPKTHKESILISRYGGETNWCTAADSEEGQESFKIYTNNNNSSLFICINKSDPKEKYQLNYFYEEFSSMDRYDEQIYDYNISLFDLILNTPEIFNELYSFETVFDYEIFDYVLPEIIDGVCKISFIPQNLKEAEYILNKCNKFEKDLIIHNIKINKLPEGLSVGRNFDLFRTDVSELPECLNVTDNLNLRYSDKIKKIPEDLIVGGNLYLSQKIEIPESSIIDGEIFIR